MASCQTSSDSTPTSRRRQIPGTRVFNWQPTDAQRRRPLVRRPITACQDCRNAKVKCNGKRNCERCKSRRLRCTYATTSSNHMNVETDCVLASPSNTANQALDELFTNVSDSAGPLHMAELENITTSEETHDDVQEQFDWFFDDFMNLDNVDYSLMPNGLHSSGANFCQSPVETLSPEENCSRRSSPRSDPREVMVLNGSSTRAICQCRATLMYQIPNLESVMMERPTPRLDKIFNVTGEIIGSCHSALDCANCQIGPVDLVSILTVFQQTATCFNYIVKSGLEGNFKVSMGDYEVQINDDPALKDILVLNLVKKANSMLDALKTCGNDIFLSETPNRRKVMNMSPVCLNKLNLEYIEEVTTKFKKLFQSMATTFGKRDE